MVFSILMVCTGNICRSPMAEGLLRHRLPEWLKEKVGIRSAGTQGLHGNRAQPEAVMAAAAHGADISAHRASMLDTAMIKSADLVLAMEKYHLDRINSLFIFRCKHARLLGTFAPDWTDPEIDDPYGLSYAAYEATARRILACLPDLIAYVERQVELKES
ncbi:low molecular weight protein-tyrosine-phosphatase [Desulfosarcina ovata]|uniref:protein-tyrosine-phosphatase n=2 Tax=Desulfosarcina ovata TaxID=83564 RepID=A0A5K8AAZ5_9BACT|nr:low molecular weight protein-tyrosine-phosphatase [Desulfosarcina ovata]BBO81900.1 low molecular weight phosphotyrosine protein phosphatase [Desulfosarcina ovata subsp. sediminis]BBO89120.1 low molecular weight phosphotyrosine protein phosphatase [Desulfosarcina ovata subsp. ovata]